MRSRTHTAAAAVGALAALAALVTTPPAAAAGPRDVTADVLAGRDVTLTGDAVVTVPPGTTTYDGAFRGEGRLRDGDFALPRSRQRQKVSLLGGDHPYVTTTDPDPPAVTVERGATLQYGNGGTTGLIGHFPYGTPAFRLNQDNIRVDGTLRLSLRSAYRFLWGTWDLSGTHPFSGDIDNGTQTNAGRPEYATSLPNVRKVLNQGTWTVDTPLGRTVTMSPSPASASGPAAPGTRGASTAEDSGCGWWPYVLSLGLLAGLAVPSSRGGRRGGGGRHAARR